MTVPYGIQINNDALPGIATTLEDAATGLDDLAGSVPSSVDAGPMTAVISPLLAQVVTSAGTWPTA